MRYRSSFQDDLKLIQRDFMPSNVTATFSSEFICHVTLAQKERLASKAAFICKFASFLSCHC